MGGGSSSAIDPTEKIGIGALKTLHQLMLDTRLLVDQVRMLGESAEAEHNTVLGPVLGNSDVPGSGCFLSPETWRKKQKSHAPRCHRTIKTIRLHICLHLQLISAIVAAFKPEGEVTDFRLRNLLISDSWQLMEQ